MKNDFKNAENEATLKGMVRDEYFKKCGFAYNWHEIDYVVKYNEVHRV